MEFYSQVLISQIKFLLRYLIFGGINHIYKRNLPKKIIFIHVPKAAGISINMSLYGNTGYGHLLPIEIIKNVGYLFFFNSFRFGFVRNPIDRFISTYYFLKNGGISSSDKTHYQDIFNPRKDINEFICDEFINNEKIQKSMHFKPQYLFSKIGKRNILNFIGKVENIEKDIQLLEKIIGQKLEIKTLNKTSKKEGKIKISHKSAEILKIFYKKDFELFGY